MSTSKPGDNQSANICQSTDIGNGIYCLDSGYLRPNLAACYLLESGGEWAVIETGIAATVPRVLAFLADRQVGADQIKYVLPTHVHLDHAGGAGALLRCLPRSRLVAHPRGAGHLIDPSRLIAGSRAVYGAERFKQLYGEVVPAPADRVLVSEDFMTLRLGQRSLLIRHAPGHAEHHYCIWDASTSGWFSGDNFGISYPSMVGANDRHLLPTTTPVQFDPDKLLATIDLMMNYHPTRIYLTHFGILLNPEKEVEKLRQAIRDYCAIARGLRHEADRIERIEAALFAREIALLQRVRPELGSVQARQELALDIKLNAQGLDVWLARQEEKNRQ